jgi:hypothetical protein
MTLSSFTDALEAIRRYGMDIVFLLVCTLVFLIISGSILASVFDPGLPPEPPVMFPDHPRSDDTGCVRIGDMDICPRDSASMDRSSTPGPSLMPMGSNVSAGDPGKLRLFTRDPYGETRKEAPPTFVQSVKLVAHLLEARETIDVYVADFENGPAAYARNLGDKFELVFSSIYVTENDEVSSISWPLLGLIAHEVAHTIYKERRGEDDLSNEASAEYFAGMAIYRAGGDLVDAFEFSQYFDGESEVHPPKELSAILTREGWKQAKARHENRYDTCDPGIIGHDIQYKDRLCKAVVSCEKDHRPIRITCLETDGDWRWQ